MVAKTEIKVVTDQQLLQNKLSQLERMSKMDMLMGIVYQTANEDEQGLDEDVLANFRLARGIIRHSVFADYEDIQSLGDGMAKLRAKEIVLRTRLFLNHGVVTPSFYPSPEDQVNLTKFLKKMEAIDYENKWVKPNFKPR